MVIDFRVCFIAILAIYLYLRTIIKTITMGTLGGRPTKAENTLKNKQVHLLLTVDEYEKLKKLSRGFTSMSDFIRCRLFYNSTFQQIQPEDFIKALNALSDNCQESKTELSAHLEYFKQLQQSGGIDCTKAINALIKSYKAHIAYEKQLANFIGQMLDASNRGE